MSPRLELVRQGVHGIEEEAGVAWRFRKMTQSGWARPDAGSGQVQGDPVVLQ